MKKNNSFVKDSAISIAGVVICKVIGLLYVIPFYAMISTSGGALYSYAYSIYALFLNLSTSGIPTAISKIISEYNALGNNTNKVRVYKIGLVLISSLGIIAFLLMMIFAKELAYTLIGNMNGGNSIEDIAFVIRIISTALLIVPLLSVTKGYFQGLKKFKEASIANILEQVARVGFLLLGCYLILNKFKLEEKFAIGAAVFAATIGAIIAYIYLFIKMKKNKNEFYKKDLINTDKKTTKDLIKQILGVAIPFILIDLFKSAYSLVDSITVIRGLTWLKFDPEVIELTFSTISTWGAKLTTIVVAITSGLAISLIPNLAADNVNNDHEKVNHKINLSLLAILFITLPMCIGICYLTQPIWIVFYEYNEVSISIFRFSIFTAASFSIYSIAMNIAQTLNHTKQVLITLFAAFILNFLGNIPFMYLCNYLGLKAYDGAIICTLVTELLPSIYLILYLRKKHNLHFKELFNNSFKVILCNILMLGSLYLTSLIYPIKALSKASCILEIIIYTIIGATVYLISSYKTGLLKEILGNRIKKIKL